MRDFGSFIIRDDGKVALREIGLLPTGTQIAYQPDIAEDLNHQLVEYGFITSIGDHGVFCRYWKKGKEGLELRTTTHSEKTNWHNIRFIKSCDQLAVTKVFQYLAANGLIYQYDASDFKENLNDR